MSKYPRKEKIIFTIAACVFTVLIATMILLLFANGRKEKNYDTPITPIESAAPQEDENALLIGGKRVDAEADTFYLSHTKLGEDDLTKLASLTKLRTLSLTACSLTKLDALASLTGLTTLYLSDNAVTDISPLASLGSLKTLYLDNNPVLDLSPLASLGNLTTLSLKGTGIGKSSVEALRRALPACSIFESGEDSARPISLGGVEFTVEVTSLDLSGRGVSDLSKLADCTRLEVLNLSGNPIESLDPLRNLPRLKNLNLTNTLLADNDLLALRSLRTLTYLNIKGNDSLTSESVEALCAALPDCNVLHDALHYRISLGANEFTDDAVEIIAAGQGVTDITGLEKFAALQTLDLSWNRVSDLTPLAPCTELRTLILENNAVSDISALAAHTKLDTLSLKDNDIRDITALSTCTHLRFLDLSGNDLSYVTHLGMCTELVWLDLRGNPQITWDSIEILHSLLPGCEILTDAVPPTPEPTPEMIFTPTVPPEWTMPPTPTVPPELPPETPVEEPVTEG